MTAPTGPAKSPNLNRESSSSEHSGFIYDSPSAESETPEYEASYEPEREFVLMPLFRRIGDLLGIRKAESEHVYVPEPSGVEIQAPETYAPISAEPEPLKSVEAPSYSEIPEFQQSPAKYGPSETTEDDVLGIEPPVLEPMTFDTQEHFEPQNEMPVSLQPEIPDPEPALVEEVPAVEPEPEFESQPQIVMAATPAEFIHEQHEYEHEQHERAAQPQFEVAPPPPSPAVVKPEPPRPQPAVRLLTQEDINALMASIREAATSISLALSQAAEWLHKKEEDILRRAEATATAISQTEKPGPQLVEKTQRVPFWKRVDWEKEFTPGRAALLGALAMAILMVIGISLARRPASSVLPEQTHAIQPGGVTVTAHPAVAATPVQARRRAPAPTHSAAPVTHRVRRQANDDGPDVVTHYYGNKSKPSPAHQSTIASGVRHYSDMQ